MSKHRMFLVMSMYHPDDDEPIGTKFVKTMKGEEEVIDQLMLLKVEILMN